MAELAPRYDPTAVEERLYQWWEGSGFFTADPASPRPPYTIVIPPPNVTGILHMGHALNNTIQDILIRWKRMQGFEALWVPGTDHAGIATQNVVEKALKKEGKRRQDLGREAFVARVWEWKEQYGNTIIRQLRRLGSSCDWSRTRFTMDEGLSNAVAEVFVRLHARGLIYRGNYIINWCPRCQTALADEEAPRKESKGTLWHIRYPLKGGGEIVVATTRPETMLGDTAVAVHPKDPRYASVVGKTAILPIVGRELRIIADEAIDPEFGTGAVKVTPAHDPVDFQLARRHGLPILNIMTVDGKMEQVPPAYAGKDRFAAREQAVADLEAQGLLVKTDDHMHGVGHCYRCDTVVEPRLSLQWFVRMKPLAETAIPPVREGRLRFTPERWTKVYLNWMENIQDWCISRQIWWGHRIPVYYCRRCYTPPRLDDPSGGSSQGLIVAKSAPASCPECGGPVTQDEDVLDTWFSSWLWPFSTLGWPEQTPSLARFYPTNTLVTAAEIIFFWVARMVMAGQFCMREIPFSDVYIHGTVRDITGRKMSKSLGNIIDPLEIIDKCGTDALRFTLVTATPIGQDVFLSDERFTVGRNFANKLWNVTRYALAMAEGAGVGPDAARALPAAESLAPADRWILSRLHATIERVTKALEGFGFSEAAQTLYDFVWHDYCDWYVEVSKIVPESARRDTAAVLLHVLEATLRLLHPMIPFVTEELWQRLQAPEAAGGAAAVGGNEAGAGPRTIMRAPWPTAEARWRAPEIEAQFATFQAIVAGIRNTRAELNVPVDTKPAVRLAATSPDTRRFLEEQRAGLQLLAHVGEVSVAETVAKSRDSAATVVDGVEVVLPLAGLIDVARERGRIQARIEELAQELSRIDARLADAQFTDRAKPEIVEHTRARRAEVVETVKKFAGHLELLHAL
jgi:valyl-tRNA synthetase